MKRLCAPLVAAITALLTAAMAMTEPGQCYRVTMTTLDGSSLVAFFKLK